MDSVTLAGPLKRALRAHVIKIPKQFTGMVSVLFFNLDGFDESWGSSAPFLSFPTLGPALLRAAFFLGS